MTAASFAIDAVVYADGTVSGQPARLRKILAQWTFQMQDLQRAIAILDKAVNQGTDRATLVSAFHSSLATDSKMMSTSLSPGIFRLPFDSVFGIAAMTLADPNNTDVWEAAVLRNKFQGWYARLSVIVPKMTAAMQTLPQ